MTLEELVIKLESWRKTKKHKMEKVPKEYWDAAIALSKEHPPKIISSKTGLNSTDLKRKLGLGPIKQKKSKKNVTFKKLDSQILDKKPVFEVTTSFGTTVKVYHHILLWPNGRNF